MSYGVVCNFAKREDGKEHTMSDYTRRLHKFINGFEFVRCFYGKCPVCGKRVFSIGDDVVNFEYIKAKFICDCGKKWKETVYSSDLGKYKYHQALVEKYYDNHRGEVNVLRLMNKIYLVTPDKIMSKEVKR